MLKKFTIVLMLALTAISVHATGEDSSWGCISIQNLQDSMVMQESSKPPTQTEFSCWKKSVSLQKKSTSAFTMQTGVSITVGLTRAAR